MKNKLILMAVAVLLSLFSLTANAEAIKEKSFSSETVSIEADASIIK